MTAHIPENDAGRAPDGTGPVGLRPEPASSLGHAATVPSRMHSDALYALVNWAEAHTGEHDPDFCEAVHMSVDEPKPIIAPNYDRSIDAAVSLLPSGAVWRKYTDPSASVYAASPYNAHAQVRYDGNAANPALQIVAAHFRMRAARAAAREARK